MTELQLDLFILCLIIILNIIISLLYRRYKNLQVEEKKRIDFGNYSALVHPPNVNSFSFMPKIPFLILKRTKNKSLHKVIIIDNILCILVYGLFTTAIINFI